jgi:protoporphyrinogen oxidase
MQIDKINNDYQTQAMLQSKTKVASPQESLAQEMLKEASSGAQALPKQLMQLLNNTQPMQTASQVAKQQLASGRLDIKV